ncbi:prenyltransferase/squalene oxidase repeat-containing protein [Laceyella putida]|uniref:Prenyltransferase/squalene oxidase repeat-containing protein n=2 Tax=Laceyella putida TaxID=110101 RepID=A0ABW2RPJ8_9BACL
MDRISEQVDKLKQKLIAAQAADGSWNFCFESGPMTDAYYLLLLKVLGMEADGLPQALIERILARQTDEGTWKCYPDEKEGNVSATLEACLALFYTGVKDPSDPLMKRARQFLLEQGGISRSGSLTQVALCLLGHKRWGLRTRVPVEFFLLPPWSPVHFFDLVSYSRVHVAPVILAADRQFCVHLPGKKEIDEWLPALSDLRLDQESSPDGWSLAAEWEDIHLQALDRQEWHQKGVQWGRDFMLSRLEEDGTLYSYTTSTFLMIFALLALGYPKHHPLLQRAMRGIATFACPVSEGMHIQEATSTIWDSALILQTLGMAGLPPTDFIWRRGARFLLSKQQERVGDWARDNPGIHPGGWGFSRSNTIHPDVDDTLACLSALTPLKAEGSDREAWQRGLTWLLSMQNDDGGWSAFERNKQKRWLSLIPFKEGKQVWGDPSSADMTGRVLRFLGQHVGWTIDRPEVRRAWSWLYHHQRIDGSWYGRWGVAYLYGTWTALTGLAAVGVPRDQPMIGKALKWLLARQNRDGGWGESCASDVKRKYIPLSQSTVVQTAWALDALIAYHDRPIPAIERGMSCLLSLLEQPDSWQWRYPVGAGLAGQFYAYYHSYPTVWPLQTLLHYRKKWGD